MSTPEAIGMAWFLGVMQAFGLISALLARLSAGSSFQTLCQWTFLGSLALMGATTIGAYCAGPGYWLLSATTLAIMIVLATYDCGRDRESAATETWQS